MADVKVGMVWVLDQLDKNLEELCILQTYINHTHFLINAYVIVMSN